MSATRAKLALLIALVGCSLRAEPEPPLSHALLDIAFADQPEVTERRRVEGALDELAMRARKRAGPVSAALRALLFDELGISREVNDASLRFVLLPHVLREKRGSCVGLGTLYLALAERVGLRAHGVLVPGHFFVRVEEQGVTHNVELLRRGEELPDSWYRERYPMADPPARAYLRPLSRAEVSAVVEFDVGNVRKTQGRWRDAQRAFDRASVQFPDFAEAHASAGMLAQLLGQLPQARSAYLRAQQANPQLQGLAQNLAVLDRELAQARAPR